MNLDEIRKAFITTNGVPIEALHAAQVPQTARLLAPEIIALAGKAARGVWLLPHQQDLLLYGLHVLAAARQTQAFSTLIALLGRPEHELDGLFGETLGITGAGLIMGLFDGDPEPLYTLMVNPFAYDTSRWEAFKAMARLVWEGRVPARRSSIFSTVSTGNGWPGPATSPGWAGRTRSAIWD